MHVRDLTPTQRKAVERSRAFRENIAAKAAELAERKTRLALTAVPIAALEAPLINTPAVQVVHSGAEVDPETVNWFVVLASAPRHADYPTIREIQVAVCKHYGVKLSELLSKRRTADIVGPRQVAMFLCKRLTPHSLPQVGRRFGGRDHTTVLHAVNKMKHLETRNPEIAEDIAILIKAITGERE